MRGAARSASTDSKSGTSDKRSSVSERTRRTSSADVVPVHAHVELREMEAEELDPPPQSGEPAVGDPGAAIRAKAPIEQREILCKVLGGLVCVGVEPPPHERQLSPVG